MAIDHDWPDDPDEEFIVGGEVFARRDIEYKRNWFGSVKLFDFEKMRKNKEHRLGPVNNVPEGKPIPIATNAPELFANDPGVFVIASSEDKIVKEGHFKPDDRSIDERMTAALKADLPDNNPKTLYGLKKPPMHLIPKPFLIILSKVMGLGAKKYGPYNWRSNKVAASVYLGAAERHIASWADGESNDPESGVSHLAHAAACIAILLDAQETGNLVDDRPPPGAAARLIRELTDA